MTTNKHSDEIRNGHFFSVVNRSMTSSRDSSETNPDPSCLLSRRAFLGTALVAGGSLALLAVPTVSTVVIPALRKGVVKWVDFGKPDQLGAVDFTMLPFEFLVKDGWQDLPQRGFVWAKNDPASGPLVLSSTCTHLACSVIWNPGRKLFLCPCHSGFFNAEGKPAGGPPQKPLARLPFKIEEGKLLVQIKLG